jgi:hypothetical protein
MVILEVNGQRVPVEFEYSFDDTFDPPRPKDTYCRVLSESPNPDNPIPQVVGWGEALLHHKDQFCRVKGRKMAFGRALQDMKIPKAERKLWWDAYKERMRIV